MKKIMLCQATFNGKPYAFKHAAADFDFHTVDGLEFAVLREKDFSLDCSGAIRLSIRRSPNINGQKVYVKVDTMKDGTDAYCYVSHKAKNMTLQERLQTPNMLDDGKTKLDNVRENIDKARAIVLAPDVPFVTTRGQKGTVGDYV